MRQRPLPILLRLLLQFLLALPALAGPARPAADFNGDGKGDLLWRNQATGAVFVMPMDGAAARPGAVVYTEPNSDWQIVAAADFDGDGKADLLWRNSRTGQVWLMLMDGTTVRSASMIYTEADTRWRIVGTGDFNGDGRADILWRHATSGSVYLMPMDGASVRPGQIIYTEPDPAWRIAAIADFDGDGKADILWWNSSTGQVFQQLMDGAAIKASSMVYREPDTSWRIVGTGDFAGRGKADILWRNTGTGQVYRLPMDGATALPGALIWTEPDPAWQIVAIRDFDGDGRDDLAWWNQNTGQIYQMLMNGSAIRSQGVVYSEPQTAWVPQAAGSPFRAATVTASMTCGKGTTVTAAKLEVEPGQTASFTLGLVDGYTDLPVQGGNGTLDGNLYSTGALAADVALSASALDNPGFFTVFASSDPGGMMMPRTVKARNGYNANFQVVLDPGKVLRRVDSSSPGLLNGQSFTAYRNGTAHAVIEAASGASRVLQAIVLGGHGTVTPASQTVADGDPAMLTVVPDLGYGPSNWYGLSGSVMVIRSGYQLYVSPVTADASVVVNFAPLPAPTTGLGLVSVRANPTVLFADEFKSAPVTVEARINGRGFTPFLQFAHNAFGGYDFSMAKIQMYDDGSHGDRVAGDGVYTATFSTGLDPVLHYYDHTLESLRLDVVPYDAAGQPLSFQANCTGIRLGVISRACATTATQVAPGATATPHALNLQFADVTGDDFSALAPDWKLYSLYPDVFDVVNLAYFGVTRPAFWPNAMADNNRVSGIGKVIQDFTWYYGSHSVLSDTIQACDDNWGFTFLHEFGHTWAFYFNDPALRLTDGANCHPLGPNSFVGIMGAGAILKEQPSGDFLVDYRPGGGASSGNPYAEVELYTMGLLPASAVPPMWFVLDPSVDCSMGAIVPRAKATRVTVDDLIRVYGQRSPAQGRTAFRGAFVAISERPLSGAELAYANRVGEFYGSQVEGRTPIEPGRPDVLDFPTFWSATGHRATLDTLLPPPK